jgi:prepilin-type N-terminal cleavage/methylation domain-containing protein
MKVGLGRRAAAQDGFTLVELAITALIIGILVTMVVMTMLFSKTRTQRSACKANLKLIEEAVAQYHAQNEGKYPPDLETLAQDGYIKASFDWMCPAGDVEGSPGSGDYRNNYDLSTGDTTCPRADHNP